MKDFYPSLMFIGSALLMLFVGIKHFENTLLEALFVIGWIYFGVGLLLSILDMLAEKSK